jgi:hypothetical protein
MIPKLTTTTENVRRKINDIIEVVNHLSRRNPDVEMKRTLRQVPYRKGSGGGVNTVWGEVVQGVIYPDPAGSPAAGYDTYWVRLLNDATPNWDSGTDYTANTLVISTVDSFRYKAKDVTPNINHEPSVSPTYWELAEISPLPLSQEVEVPEILEGTQEIDMRDFLPFYQVGDVVELLIRQIEISEEMVDVYFFAQQMTRVAVDQVKQSIMWNEDDNRMMAVYA